MMYYMELDTWVLGLGVVLHMFCAADMAFNVLPRVAANLCNWSMYDG